MSTEETTRSHYQGVDWQAIKSAESDEVLALKADLAQSRRLAGTNCQMVFYLQTIVIPRLEEELTQTRKALAAANGHG